VENVAKLWADQPEVAGTASGIAELRFEMSVLTFEV